MNIQIYFLLLNGDSVVMELLIKSGQAVKNI